MKYFLKFLLIISLPLTISYFLYNYAAINIENNETHNKEKMQKIKIGLENKSIIQATTINVAFDNYYVVQYYQFKTNDGITCISQKNDIRSISCVH